MKSVLISIQPYWVFLIIARAMSWNILQEKSVEVRKDYPKASDWNKVTHIYCSKNRKSFNRIPKQYQPLMEKFLGCVIGEFVCDRIDSYIKEENNLYWWTFRSTEEIEEIKEKTRLTIKELVGYTGDSKHLYGWRISDLKIYDTPKKLGEFYRWKKCDSCKMSGYEATACMYDIDCKVPARITRPPQSWCYVEKL